MLSNFYLLYYLIGVLKMAGTALALVGITLVIVAGGVLLTALISTWDSMGRKDEVIAVTRYNRLKKALKKPIIILLIFSLLLCFIPSRKDVLTFIALKEVDKYNTVQIDSNLNSQKIIGTTDQIFEIVDQTLKKVESYLEPRK